MASGRPGQRTLKISDAAWDWLEEERLTRGLAGRGEVIEALVETARAADAAGKVEQTAAPALEGLLQQSVEKTTTRVAAALGPDLERLTREATRARMLAEELLVGVYGGGEQAVHDVAQRSAQIRRRAEESLVRGTVPELEKP